MTEPRTPSFLRDRQTLDHDRSHGSTVALFLAEAHEHGFRVTLSWPAGDLDGRVCDLPDPGEFCFDPAVSDRLPRLARTRSVEVWVRGGDSAMRGLAEVIDASGETCWRVAMPQRLERVEQRQDTERSAVEGVTADLVLPARIEPSSFRVLEVSRRGLRLSGGPAARDLRLGEHVHGVLRLMGQAWCQVHLQVRSLDPETGVTGVRVTGAEERRRLGELLRGLAS